MQSIRTATWLTLKNLVRIFAASLLLSAVSQIGWASITIPIDLKRDSAAAGVVCVGQALSAKRMHDVDTGNYVLAKFRVDRVLKGKVNEADVIDIRYLIGQQHFTGYDLVFLKSGDSSYTFSRTEGCMAVAKSGNLPRCQTAGLNSLLRWEIVNSLQADTNSDPMLLAALHDALSQTQVLSIQDINAYVKPFFHHKDIRIQAMAYGACLSAGDTSIFSSALDLLDALSEKTPSGQGVPTELSRALEQLPLSSAVVPLVGEKLRSKCPETRRIACYMLRQSKTKLALPYLQNALDDSDVHVRYNAVMGLSAITKDNTHAPAHDYFVADEKSYIGYWKAKNIK